MRCVPFITVLLVVSACKSPEEKPKPPPPPIDGIEIVNPGKEPRQLLRYKVATGTTPLAVTTDFDIKLADKDLVMPRLELAIDVTITSVDAAGAHVKMVVVGGKASSRSEADLSALPIMERQAKQLAGMVVTYTLTPTGALESPKVEEANRDLSTPMQEQTAQLLQTSEQLAMVLPDKPVGVGAIWKHRRTMTQNQLTFVTMTTIEVTAIDGDAVAYKGTLEMTGADQTLQQGSATMQVTHVGGTGSQTGTFDLGKAVVTGEMKATLGFEIIAEMPRATKTDVTYRIAPRATDAN